MLATRLDVVVILRFQEVYAARASRTRIAYNSIEDCIILIHMSVHEHEKHAPANLKVGVITASDSRTPENDESGKLIRSLLEAAGHLVAYYAILPDHRHKTSAALVTNLKKHHAIIVTGGT